MKRVLLLLALVANAAAFKFLSNFKASSLIPRPSSMLRRRKAAKVYGGKKLAVVTGASSGLGLQTAAALLRTGEYHVFGAVRDLEKMRDAAQDEDFPMDNFTPMEIDLNSFESVQRFCDDLEKAKLNRPIDRLICSAAVYQPEEVEWSQDNHAQTLQVNYLSNFLLVSRLLPGMARSNDARVILVGGASAEDGVAVYPRAELGNLDGFKAGFERPISMPDGFNYQGAKAYKDSKLCLSMLSTMLHDRYYKQMGVAFSTVYPGHIARSALFEGKPDLDSSSIGGIFDALGMRGTAGTVSCTEAAQRLFQAAHDGRCSKSGVYWSWLEGDAAKEAANAAQDDATKQAGWETIYETEPSEQMTNPETSQDLWKLSTALTGASWLPAYQPKSPCPTLVVVGAITKANIAKEEAKRTLEGLEDDGKGGLKVRAKIIGGTASVVDAVVSNTIGRAGKLAQDKLLGGMVDEALEGSFQETVDVKTKKPSPAQKMEPEDELAAVVEDKLLADSLQRRVDKLAIAEDQDQ